MNDVQVAAVIATYKESATIRDLVRQLVSFGWAVCVVDDSPYEYPHCDGTGWIACSEGAFVIERGSKQGIASAYMEGFKTALTQWSPDYIVQMDAGGTHDPHDAFRMVDKAHWGSCDFVVANRFAYPVPFTRRSLISRGAAWLMRKKGVWLWDVTCGLRVWRSDLLREIISEPLKSEGFAFQLELLYRAYKLPTSIGVYPIDYMLTNSTFKPGMIAEALRIYAGLK
jgi:dolichol-phosphate mannosyltransferase